MTCHNCRTECQRFGKHRNGLQRFRCRQCSKTFTAPHENPLDGMYLPPEKAEFVLRLLLEGSIVSSTERLTGVHHTTILKLLVLACEKCERLMGRKLCNVPVRDVQADEIWSFVGKKEKARKPGDDPNLGDCYTFVAIATHTKLVLNIAIGRRDQASTDVFIEGLRQATASHFQITTDGFAPYRKAISDTLEDRVDFAQLVRVYRATPEGERRYSPAEVVSTEAVRCAGRPDPERICTSHVERQDLSIRKGVRRFTRLTSAFSSVDGWRTAGGGMIEWPPALERPPPRTPVRPEAAGLFGGMRRYNAPMPPLFVLCLLTVSIQAPQTNSQLLPTHRVKEKDQPQKGQHVSTHLGDLVPPFPATTGPAAVVSKKASTIEQGDSAAELNQAGPFSPPTWPSWALVVVGIAGVFLARRTLIAIENQVRANRDSAEASRLSAVAAKASADALIAGERAWLAVIRMDPPPDLASPILAREVIPQWLVAHVVNCGRTVARLHSPIDVNFESFPNVASLPEQPHYVPLRQYRAADLPEYGRILVPNESLEVRVPLQLLEPGEVEAVRAGARFLCAYASIRYCDFTGGERDFRFCYEYVPEQGNQPAGFRLGGPKEYNKQT